jgi:hypothetical protein
LRREQRAVRARREPDAEKGGRAPLVDAGAVAKQAIVDAFKRLPAEDEEGIETET